MTRLQNLTISLHNTLKNAILELPHRGGNSGREKLSLFEVSFLILKIDLE